MRVVAYCLRERLAWCDPDGTPRAPREVIQLQELDDELALDRKSIRSALARAIEERYLEAVVTEEGVSGFRLRIDLTRFTTTESEFNGFYPFPTHRVRVPLEFFTTVVSRETLSTIKVVACIIRLTLGSVDNLGRTDVSPAISQQQFVRRMNMGRRQAIEGVQSALARNYIRRLEQGSLETGRPSTYGLYWRSQPQALSWPEARPNTTAVVSLGDVLGKRDQGVGKRDQEGLGKRDQGDGKKGSGGQEKGIRGMGKRDQADGKRGSGENERIDLLKDLDLRSRSSSASHSPAEGSLQTPGAAAAAGTLFERVKNRFPLGNARIIRQFVADRGSFVREVLDAIDEVDPAFLRRFTRSADPHWAVFHTCCQQGILPPQRVPVSPPRSPTATVDETRERDENARWRSLDDAGRIAELVKLWHSACRLQLDGYVIGPEETEAFAHTLTGELERGASRHELEALVFADLARRHGKPLGPFGEDAKT